MDMTVEKDIENVRVFIHALAKIGAVEEYRKLCDEKGFSFSVREMYSRYPELSQSLDIEAIAS